MTDNKQNNDSLKAVVGDQPGSFKGSVGAAAITSIPVDRVSQPAPSEPSKGLGSSQISSIPVPQVPPAAPSTNQ